MEIHGTIHMIRCHNRYLFVLLALLLFPTAGGAMELTGRFSLLGSGAISEQGDIGYLPGGNRHLFLDQESLRVMLDDVSDTSEWSLHFKGVRQNFVRFPATSLRSSDLFRSDKLSGNWQDYRTIDHATRIGYEVDRAYVKFRMENLTLAVGRQPVDWGSGRFWQPLNVFGAFAPTDLDTDYKPGIDAVVGEWFPSSFSSLSLVFVPVLNRQLVTTSSGAACYRQQVGDSSEIGLVGGSVLGERVAGASLEGDYGGMGWRVEGIYTMARQGSVFWIAGVDYQFEEGTMLTLEWYENSAGASNESQLPLAATDKLVLYGLQQHLGRHLLGVAAGRDITPLLRGDYTLLASGLKDASNRTAFSLLHQMSLTYSVSNESDLLLSLLTTTGKGVDAGGMPRSEFGHLPASMMLRYRIYF